MDELLKGQFQLWLDQNGLEDDAVYQAGLALDRRLGSLPDFLDIEPMLNEYQYLTAERAFCAGFAWAVARRAGKGVFGIKRAMVALTWVCYTAIPNGIFAACAAASRARGGTSPPLANHPRRGMFAGARDRKQICPHTVEKFDLR